MKWIDSTLAVSDDNWKIVIGHHPVYADTDKSESERADMQKRVGTIPGKYDLVNNSELISELKTGKLDWKTRIVVLLTAITMAVEIFFGLKTNSMALLADGIHMGSHVLLSLTSVVIFITFSI